jgi:hypothetical protein
VLLCSTCHVEGDIQHEALVLEAGAFFDGNCIHPDYLLDGAPKKGGEISRTLIGVTPQPGAPKARHNKETVLGALYLLSSDARALLSPLRSRALSNYLFILLLLAGVMFAIANVKLPLSAGEKAAKDSQIRILAAYDFLSAAPSGFESKVQTRFRELSGRRDSFLKATSHLFEGSVNWMYALVPRKVAGQPMLAENHPIVSNVGAIRAIQLAPASHEKMPEPRGPGVDFHDSHDHAITVTTDLHSPRILDPHIQANPTLQANSSTDVISTASVPDAVSPHIARSSVQRAEFTRPDGSPVWIDVGIVKSIRAAFPGEYPSSVQSVVSLGTSNQGVRESVAEATALIREHGGKL